MQARNSIKYSFVYEYASELYSDNLQSNCTSENSQSSTNCNFNNFPCPQVNPLDNYNHSTISPPETPANFMPFYDHLLNLNYSQSLNQLNVDPTNYSFNTAVSPKINFPIPDTQINTPFLTNEIGFIPDLNSTIENGYTFTTASISTPFLLDQVTFPANISDQIAPSQINSLLPANFVQPVIMSDVSSIKEGSLLNNEQPQLLKEYIKICNRKYRCTICNNRFTRQEHLRRHYSSIHVDKKPYICDFPGCGRPFKRTDNLRQHKKTHNKVSHKERSSKCIRNRTKKD